ncbi:hypothetical protein P6709_10105 [Jeotgalibacillus sp. ET6]|uniref:hypothetical protein n=1 Tax=Jeotgalibacillus sp. ET6 TaxID=3037260 RepID=UPI00241854DB|nr:hypothetical protein [Jeotgalibacillus sp. ET6]MDG5472105.1 hypothetical protein [Jeotgalibacillus sp. ET6]
MTNNYSNNQYKEAENIANDFINKNHNNIKEVTIQETEDSPMGGIVVRGTANGIEFSVSVDSDNQGELSFGGIMKSEGFPETKEECINEICE